MPDRNNYWHYTLLLLLALLGGGTSACAQDTAPSSTVPYDTLLAKINTTRTTLHRSYNQANTQKKKDSILNVARTQLVKAVAVEIAPRWFGTAWDFNGVSQVPGEGTIACGYFVSTLLRDAGLKVERVRMAQQASENITKSLCTEAEIKRFRNASLANFVDAVQAWGAGLYIVGLDYHVGFLYHDGKTVHFIHSSYYVPKTVIKEEARSSAVLNSSKYRVVGKISANNRLILKWLQGTTVKTVR